jgi:hypothetical protein
MDYSFDVDHAKQYGLFEAVMLHNFIFWLRHNRANKRNAYDGRTWTYNTLDAFAELFPFWTVKQIRRILDSLLEQRVIVKGNYNARAYDRTCWYALVDESLLELPGTVCPNGQMEKPKRAEAFAQMGTPIPDLKPDEKPEREERAPARGASSPPRTTRAPEAVSSLSSLLMRMKAEAQSRGAPLVVGRDWTAGLAELLTGGAIADELLQAFIACMETAPDRVSFFPRDFLRWRKASRQRMKRSEPATDYRERDRQAAEDRARILAEQESVEGRELVAAAVSRLPWRRAFGDQPIAGGL